MDEDPAMWKAGLRVRSFMEVQKGKKIIFERLFSRNKRINALTEVKENQYLTASGIKSFQKQTVRNNCLVCMTGRLIVRRRAAEITFPAVKLQFMSQSSCHSYAVGGQLRAERAK